MPQASEQLRGLMEAWFDDPISDWGPLAFLEGEGWVNRRGMLSKPGVNHLDDVEYKERRCLDFLIAEWDFGWERGGRPRR